MKRARKLLSALTAADFECSHVWLAELPTLEFAVPVDGSADLESDTPYLALTNYTLHDGAVLRGYCFIYDCTGHVVFDTDGRAVPISTYEETCSLDEALAAATALGRSIDNVFPVQFQATVNVFKRLPSGLITLRGKQTTKIVSA